MPVMEPEGSLLCLQQPATGHYPELESPSHTISVRSRLIFSHLHLGLLNGLFPSGFQQQHCRNKTTYCELRSENPKELYRSFLVRKWAL